MQSENASLKERNDSTDNCKIDKHEKNVARTEIWDNDASQSRKKLVPGRTHCC